MEEEGTEVRWRRKTWRLRKCACMYLCIRQKRGWGRLTELF